MTNPITVSSRYYDKVPDPNLVHMHTHETYELYCFLTGDAKYSVEGNFYDLRSGDILIMKRAEAHCLLLRSNAPYERYVINFYPEAILRGYRDPIMDFIHQRPLGQLNRYPSSLFKQNNWLSYLDKICTSPPDEQQLYLTVLLDELKNAYPIIQKSRQKTEEFSGVISFINEHMTEELTLDDISRFAFLSKSQLNRKFKAATGSTIWNYITIKRLLMAKDLLHHGSHPTTVFLQCGFHDYSSFYRSYKSHFGLSPIKDFQKRNP